METKDQIEERLREIRLEEKRLLAELGAIMAQERQTSTAPLGRPTREITPKTADEKIALFEELFACRRDVFPRLWENTKTGKKGYSPVCTNEWRTDICDKPRIKCGECPNQSFPPLDGSALRRHLAGNETLGTYAIREDETCIFLACDFDGTTWKEDATAYARGAENFGIQVGIERSRSGDGAHAWIFFSEPVPARLARQLGTAIMARVSAARHTLKLSSYDRFFPNQDCLPKGGFGNLIALPL